MKRQCSKSFINNLLIHSSMAINGISGIINILISAAVIAVIIII